MPLVAAFQTAVDELLVPEYEVANVTVVEAFTAAAVRYALKLQLFGHEFDGQSLEFAANNSGVFAGRVCAVEKVTVAEPLLMLAVPVSGEPVRYATFVPDLIP